MKASPQFLENIKEVITEDSLTKLKNLVELYQKYTKEIKTIDEKLAETKGLLLDIAGTRIPELLNSYGLSEIKLDTGEKVIVKEDLSATIINQDMFFNFLKVRNEDDICKLTFKFSRMKSDKIKELYAFLMEQDYDYESEQKVHAKTAVTYFKGLLGVGKSDFKIGLKTGKYVKKEFIKDFVKLFTFYKTKIK